MHYLCYVMGPSTRAELDNLLFKFGPDSPLEQVNEEGPNMLEMDNTFRVIHDYICSIALHNQPTYLILSQEGFNELDKEDIAGLEYDGILVYGDDSKMRFYMDTSPYLFDWYSIGGRWMNHFYIKPDITDAFDSTIVSSHPDEIMRMVEDTLTERLGKAGLIGQMDRIGANAAYLKDIDWDRFGAERLTLYETQYKVIMKHHPDAKSFNTIMEEVKLESVPAEFFNPLIHKRFYDQLDFEAMNADLGKGESIWASLLLVGMAAEDVKELAYLSVYSPEYTIIEGELITKYKFGTPTLEELRAHRDKILALDPMTIVTAVDIHN